MKNYLIISNKNEKSIMIQKKLELILRNGWKINETNPEYIFVIGGDGTFLRNLEKINSFVNSYVIPINGGNFGFYSHYNLSNLKSILKEIENKSKYYKPLLINSKINNIKYISINEILLTSNKTLMLKIEINGVIYQKFIGTGILISTPTGSTGRNKSAGGAVIFPNMDLIQLLEIEPINQKKYSTLTAPIILEKNTKIKITILNDNKKNYLIIDGNKILDINNLVVSFNFDKSNFYLFKPCDSKSYIKKLRKAFISGG